MITGRQQVMDAYIHSNLFAGRWKQLSFHFARKTGIPLPCLSANTERLDLPFHLTMPTHPYPSYPCDAQPPTIQLETIAIFLQSKTIKAIPSFETGITRGFPSFHPPKEGLEGFVQILYYTCMI